MSKTITVVVVLSLAFTLLFVAVVPTRNGLDVRKMWKGLAGPVNGKANCDVEVKPATNGPAEWDEAFLAAYPPARARKAG